VKVRVGLTPVDEVAAPLGIVIDVLRATSTICQALASGFERVICVGEIDDARALAGPGVALAGERDNVRIDGFDFGNSPREFTKEKVAGKTIVMTTTNGTRALRSCAHAQTVLISSFLNLKATADFVLRASPENLLLICSGTYEETAYEDALGAGALCDALWNHLAQSKISDSAKMARELHTAVCHDVATAASTSRNGTRLLGIPDLRPDVLFCMQRDLFNFSAAMQKDGKIQKL